MPLGVVLLLEVNALAAVVVLVEELAELLGGDGADLGVVAAQVTVVVEEGVNVQGRCAGAARQLAQAQDELLLEVVGEVVLGAEEDDAALRDWRGGGGNKRVSCWWAKTVLYQQDGTSHW